MPKQTVIIIEDDMQLSKLCQKAFEKAGFGTEVAFDGQEGLDKLKEMKPKPAAILLDVMMPNMNGFEFLEEAKKLKLGPIPVAALTNLSQNEDMAKMKKLGASLY